MRNRGKVIAFAFFAFSFITTTTQAQCVNKGTFEIDAYYGFPNLLSLHLKDAYNGQQNLNFKSIGPIGIRGEYFITDYIAFGTDFNYSKITISWKQLGFKTSEYDNHSLSVQRLRILGKFNVHFGASDHFDWYAGTGLGYNHIRYIETINGTRKDNYTDYLDVYNFPISFRIDFGGKYFFSENMGIGFEVGLGGPLAAVGLTTKF